MSKNFAAANFESLGTGPATGAREMGHGGGSLKPGEEGTGVRANKLRSRAETTMQETAFEREPRLRERVAVYSDVVNRLMSDRLTPEEAGAKIANVWEKQAQEAGLEPETAFNPHAVIEWIRRGVRSGELSPSEVEQLVSDLRTRIIAEYIRRWKETAGNTPSKEALERVTEMLDKLLEYFSQPTQPASSWEATAARLSETGY